MDKNSPARPDSRRPLIIAALFAACLAAGAQATVTTYTTDLDGASESPPNLSPGTGFAQVDLDDAAHTMRVFVTFAGLEAGTTAAHIHAATSVPGEGTAGVATTTPTFAGFPTGVTAGTYEITLDMTQASSYNPSFITMHGGTTEAAEAFLFASIAAGTAYFNIHTGAYPGGEIRGFFAAGSVSITETKWGELKALFR